MPTQTKTAIVVFSSLITIAAGCAPHIPEASLRELPRYIPQFSIVAQRPGFLGIARMQGIVIEGLSVFGQPAAAGFLLPYRDRWFVITAEHVAAYALDNGNTMLFATMGKSFPYQPQQGHWAPARSEKLDVAAFPWDSPQALTAHPLRLIGANAPVVAKQTPLAILCNAQILKEPLRVGVFYRQGAFLTPLFPKESPAAEEACSGSAVFDINGYVFGMIIMRNPGTASQTARAVRSEEIARFLDESYFTGKEN